MKILVIGSGAFGTALATTLAKKTASVCLWVPNEELKSSIKLTKKKTKVTDRRNGIEIEVAPSQVITANRR